jgi:hypothetical protein
MYIYMYIIPCSLLISNCFTLGHLDVATPFRPKEKPAQTATARRCSETSLLTLIYYDHYIIVISYLYSS